MAYRVGIYIIALLFMFSSQALAHSVLKEANPKPGEVVKADLSEISLVFTTKVETSVVKLTNEKGGVIEPKVSVQHDTVKAALETSLSNGIYTLNWSIVGADGHPIKNQYEFEVAVPSPTPEPVQQKEPEQPKKEEPVLEEPKSEERKSEEPVKVEPTPPLEEHDQPTDEKGTSFLVTSVVILVALLGIGSLILLMRRKG